MPNFFWSAAVLVAVHGPLGNRKAAQESLQQLLQLKPDIARTMKDEMNKWFVEAELVELMLDGLRKGGLDVDDSRHPAATTAVRDQAAPRPSHAPSVAVLPFANMSADKEQEYFSDGLAEEIINLLAQVPGLKVIARTSAFAFRGKDEDVRRIAQALDVTHVLEGSVRRAGGRVGDGPIDRGD